jgi:hypothetical protein
MGAQGHLTGNRLRSLIPPFDLTLPEMHDMGWFTDANLDGQEESRVPRTTNAAWTPF